MCHLAKYRPEEATSTDGETYREAEDEEKQTQDSRQLEIEEE